MPRDTLGPASATVLVVANMIGAGVFTSSGYALADLQSRPLVLLAWLLGAALALLGALSYAALARRLPGSGGEYHYLARAVHPLAGFLAGWVSLLAGFTAPIAVAAAVLQSYLAPSLGGGLAPEWIGTGAIVAAAVLHGLRLRGGVLAQNGVVALKLLLVGAFLVLGATRLAPLQETLPEPPFRPAAFAETLLWVSFSYSGWNAAVYVAAELRDPARDVARAMLGGTAIAGALYLALNAVFLYAAPVAELAGHGDIGARAASALGGPGLRRLVEVAVGLALLSSISAMVMAGPRVYARMAEDGLLPRAFDPRGKVPRAAIALQAGLAILVLWLGDLRDLLSYVGFCLSLGTAAAVAALMRLRWREGAARVPMFGFPWVPGTFVLASVLIGAFSAPRAAGPLLATAATLLLGILAYAFLRRAASVG
ncbi:MAG: APC family permease [Planctomycetota bacterium]